MTKIGVIRKMAQNDAKVAKCFPKCFPTKEKCFPKMAKMFPQIAGIGKKWGNKLKKINVKRKTS